ncbi:MAG: putative peptidoglycan lipid II flippase MurJ [Candidatus Carbobacillus altaicus]|uniref:Probable lipid II flippase MurJ n=1 Tax=Candidatus Carbonibacillus altaicus TaxID=2163959 RepID=A0A2R6Y5L5_9BACL|nr:MAG: putative peptidoglycan lipid II flippase MurJ [Candidatus Carbobacillus altaicus]
MSRGLYTTTVAIMVITLVSRILGFLRETAIAAYFGASEVSDAFFIAFSIPGVLFAAMASAIGTTFIPVYQRLGKEDRTYFMHNITSVLIVMSLAVTVISIFFAPYLVKIFAPGFETETFHLSVQLTRILLWMVVLLTLNALFTAYLQSHQYFLMPAAVGIPFNIVVVLYLFMFGASLGIVGFTWITLVATIAQVLFLVPSLLRAGYRYRFVIDLKEQGLRQATVLVGPVMIGTIASQLNIIVDRMLASGLTEGSISALNYSNKVMQLAYGIVVISLLSVLYPRLSKIAANNDWNQFRLTLSRTTIVLLLVLLPITVGSMVLAKPIISVLFERGVFDAQATELTAGAYFFFSIGLIGLGTRELWTKAFYSLQDTKTPMTNGIFAIGLNIVLNLILVGPMQHLGLALATSISFIVASFLQYRSLTRQIGTLWTKTMTVSLLKMIAASTVMGGVVYALSVYVPWHEGTFVWRAFLLTAIIVLGALTYVVMLFAFREDVTLDVMRRGWVKLKGLALSRLGAR